MMNKDGIYVLFCDGGNVTTNAAMVTEKLGSMVKYKKMHSDGLRTLINTVMAPRLIYPCRFMALEDYQMRRIWRPIQNLWKHRCKVAVTAPYDVFDFNLTIVDLADAVTSQQTLMWLAMINGEDLDMAMILEKEVGRSLTNTGNW